MGSWKRGLLGGGALLALAGAALIAGVAGSASGQAGPSMFIDAPSQNIAANAGEFQIDIKVANVQNLGAYDIAMTFDPNVIEYVGAGDNGFLATTGRQQSCLSFERAPSIVNTQKIVRVGCGTNGIINGGQGKQGPSGSGTLATIIFKPKAVGTSNLVFVGLDAPYPLGTQPPESGQTTLTLVEVCGGGVCQDDNVTFSAGTGVVQVYDPNAPVPTAVPATPTPQPRDDAAAENYQKTVAAAVGTPRTLPTQPGTGTTANPTAPTGAVTGEGPTSGGATSGGTIQAPDTGQRLLTPQELASSGAPAGSTIGSDGVVRGPDGVPLTGYGPQGQGGPDSGWYLAGFALLAGGLVAMALGAAASRLQRARARD